MEDRRPNPEQLLKTIRRLDEEKGRGRLRVFLGMCAGVGKTYAMLKAAREQQQRLAGIAGAPDTCAKSEVLVGIVETHGRKETEELLKPIKVLPRKKLEYKGTAFSELDIDEILKRRPSLVLVDELAHTNAPGSRNKRRFQDVEEILAAGIDVYTTINIQHIESRNDQVAQITGVQVRETVPDSFLEKASQIEVVDLAPSELLHRLSEGKVYLGNKAVTAAENFFKEEQLTALRELALRFTAEKVDQDLQDQMTMKGVEGPWQTNERLLVAVSHSPYSSRLIRRTRRMAYNLEAPWIALYVNTGEVLSAKDQETLQSNIVLAKELGAEVISIADTDLVYAVRKICNEKNVTQIIMGRPDRRFFSDLLAQGSLLDRLVRSTKEFDVHVIRAERNPKYRGFHLYWPWLKSSLVGYYYTVWFIGILTVACWIASPFVGYRALGSVYLLSILAVASLTSIGPVFLAAVLSAIAWNFFFIPPLYTFTISSGEDWMMLLSYFVAALVGGILTARIRRQEVILQTREERTKNLYEFGKALSEAKNLDGIIDVLKMTVKKQFKGDAEVILADKNRKLQESTTVTAKDKAVASWAFAHNKSAGWSTQTLSAAPCLCLPMKANTEVIGVLAFYPSDHQKSFSIDQEIFLDAIIGQAAIAVERLKFSEAAQAAKLYEASEKLHQTLINSVSHELRTPITALIGTATALKDRVTLMNDKAREALTDELIGSAKRLDRVVENLLDMSRIEKGTIQIKREWFQVGDLLDDVEAELKDELFDREIMLTGNAELLVEGDFRLLQHAISNLILNSVKYSEPKSPIEINVSSAHEKIIIALSDYGKGIPPGSEEVVFEKFFRLPGTPTGGLGLGLYIVKSIIELHDGSIKARNRTDVPSGATFECTLPLRPPPAELKEIVK